MFDENHIIFFLNNIFYKKNRIYVSCWEGCTPIPNSLIKKSWKEFINIGAGPSWRSFFRHHGQLGCALMCPRQVRQLVCVAGFIKKCKMTWFICKTKDINFKMANAGEPGHRQHRRRRKFRWTATVSLFSVVVPTRPIPTATPIQTCRFFSLFWQSGGLWWWFSPSLSREPGKN